MIATQPKSRQILGVNQQSYQLLNASMGLNLRRQLLIAVCDSVVMQNQLATQLEADLAETRTISNQSEFDSFEDADLAGFPRKKVLERIIFDPEDGNLPKQVAQWVRQRILAEGTLPQIQILGIEQMTRQPAITQNHFLRSLEKIDALLPRINTSLLIWVPWPWLRTIQQSAPTFWNWRNGVFEFVSDPTPVAQDALALSPAVSKMMLPEGLPEGLPEELLEEISDVSPAISPASSADAETSDARLLEAAAPASSYPVAIPQATIPQANSQAASYQTAWPSPSVEEEDDLSGLFEEELSVQSPVRRALVASGGLTSIVTQGVNAADSEPVPVRPNQPPSAEIEQSLSQVNRSAEAASEATKTGADSDETADSVETTNSKETPRADERPREALPTAQTPVKPPVESTVERPVEEDYLAAGRGYRTRIEAGERGLVVIESAIAAYEGGLRYLTGTSPDWSIGLNDLGTLYWLKAQQVEDPQQAVEGMTHSIELYQDALARLKPNQSELIGQLYSNMGAVYSMLATYQNSVDYLNEAVQAYRQALPTCSLADDPEEYATLHNSLGSVYWKLSHYEQIQSNLHKAIAAYSAALSGYRPETQPLEYAAVQNNLGITYWSLAKHEKSQFFLKQAIAAYSDALNYRTPESDPAACAITYNNLALAYWDLSKSSDLEQIRRAQAQKNAVTAFEAALNISKTSGALNNMDSTAIYHCLGDVHGQMAETAPSPVEIGESLGKSLYSYIQSLKGVSEAAPVYAGRVGAIVANLRSHYTHLGLEGQQAALSKVPSDLLAQVLAAL